MAKYYFQHPEHTNHEVEFLAKSYAEAKAILADKYDLGPDEIFNLTYEGYVWKKEENP